MYSAITQPLVPVVDIVDGVEHAGPAADFVLLQFVCGISLA